MHRPYEGLGPESDWHPQPQAAQLAHQLVDDFLQQHDAGRELSRRMQEETGTRFFDWVDHLVLPGEDYLHSSLEESGFQKVASGPFVRSSYHAREMAELF